MRLQRRTKVKVTPTTTDAQGLRTSLDDLTDVERRKAGLAAKALVIFAVATVLFIGLTVWNRFTLSDMHGRFDTVEQDLRDLTCFAAELTRRPPPGGTVCPAVLPDDPPRRKDGS